MRGSKVVCATPQCEGDGGPQQIVDVCVRVCAGGGCHGRCLGILSAVWKLVAVVLVAPAEDRRSRGM